MPSLKVWVIGILVIGICLGFEFWDLGLVCHLSRHRNSIPRMNSWAIFSLPPRFLSPFLSLFTNDQ